MTRRQQISTRQVLSDRGPVFEKFTTGDSGRQVLVEEAARLRQIRHPNVVRLVSLTDGDLTTVRLELAPGAPLDALHPIPPERLLRIFKSLLRIVGEIHEMGWSHGRLRAEHVIVGSTDAITLCSWSDATPANDRNAASDRAAVGAMFVELGGRDARYSRRDDRQSQQRLLSLVESSTSADRNRGAPMTLQQETRSAARGSHRDGQRAQRMRWPGLPPVDPRQDTTNDDGDELTSAQLGGVVAGCVVTAAILLAVVGVPRVPGRAAFDTDLLGASISTITWGYYLLAAWSGTLAAIAVIARLAGHDNVSAGAISLTPLRRTGALALVASSGIVASIGSSGPPSAAVDATTATTLAPPSTADGGDHLSGDHARGSTASADAVDHVIATSPDTSPARAPAPAPETSSTDRVTTVASRDSLTIDEPVNEPPSGIWTVQPGDHFWSIAERAAGSAENHVVADYWTRLVELNQDTLVNPDDTDLLIPGQVLMLPDRSPSAPH